MRCPNARVLVLLLAGCGASEASSPRAPDPAPSRAEPEERAEGGGLEVSAAIRRSMPKTIACEEGDACGYFLQVVSPGSDADALAARARGILEGKCRGRVIVYRDPRAVLGAGIVVATLEEKRACEKALGRSEDRDFPSAMVFRVAG